MIRGESVDQILILKDLILILFENKKSCAGEINTLQKANGGRILARAIIGKGVVPFLLYVAFGRSSGYWVALYAVCVWVGARKVDRIFLWDVDDDYSLRVGSRQRRFDGTGVTTGTSMILALSAQQKGLRNFS